MIPIPTLTIPFIILFYWIPALGTYGFPAFVLFVLVMAIINRKLLRRHKKKTIALFIFLLLCKVWGEFSLPSDEDIQAAKQRVVARRLFHLAEDYVHGDIIIPKGSRVYRVDNWDSGRIDYPITLTDTPVVEFSKPVQIAGIWASGMDLNALTPTYPKLLLAQDQVTAGEHCRKGQVATFDNSEAHWARMRADVRWDQKPPPEGRNAQVHPIDWKFLSCADKEYREFAIPDTFANRYQQQIRLQHRF